MTDNYQPVKWVNDNGHERWQPRATNGDTEWRMRHADCWRTESEVEQRTPAWAPPQLYVQPHRANAAARRYDEQRALAFRRVG